MNLSMNITLTWALYFAVLFGNYINCSDHWSNMRLFWETFTASNLLKYNAEFKKKLSFQIVVFPDPCVSTKFPAAILILNSTNLSVKISRFWIVIWILKTDSVMVLPFTFVYLYNMVVVNPVIRLLSSIEFIHTAWNTHLSMSSYSCAFIALNISISNSNCFYFECVDGVCVFTIEISVQIQLCIGRRHF